MSIWVDLWALTLAGPTGNQPVLSLIAVHHLDNRLYLKHCLSAKYSLLINRLQNTDPCYLYITTKPVEVSSTKIDLNLQKIDGTTLKAVQSFII